MDEDKNKIIFQNVIMENREKITLSGILDVYSFDDQMIIVATELGLLTIKGANLKITKLNIDTSEFIAEGYINSIAYTNSDNEFNKKSKSLFTKIFK